MKAAAVFAVRAYVCAGAVAVAPYEMICKGTVTL